MNLQLDGKRALVMGASSGLGRAVAEALVREGAKVAICSRSEERIQSTQSRTRGCQRLTSPPIVRTDRWPGGTPTC